MPLKLWLCPPPLPPKFDIIQKALCSNTVYFTLFFINAGVFIKVKLNVLPYIKLTANSATSIVSLKYKML